MIKLGHKYRVIRPAESDRQSNVYYGMGWDTDHEQYIGREFVVSNDRAIMNNSGGGNGRGNYVKKFNIYFKESWLQDIGMGRCKVCGNELSDGHIKRAQNNTGRAVVMCDSCYNELYISCSKCSGIMRSADERAIDIEGRLYCGSCAREMRKISLDTLPPVNDEDIAKTVALLDVRLLSFAPVEVAIGSDIERDTVVRGSQHDARCVEIADSISEATAELNIYGLSSSRPQHFAVQGYTDREYEKVKEILIEHFGGDTIITSERISDRGTRAIGIRYDMRTDNFHQLLRAIKKIAIVPQVEKRLITFENKVDKRFMAQLDKIMA